MRTDIELVAEIKEGNIEAFSELVLRYQRLLLRLAMRVTRDLESAEDIVQETFLKVYNKIDLFEGRSSFKSWLYQITLNTAKNSLRSKKHHASLEDVEQACTMDSQEGGLLKENIKEILQEEVEKLPDKQKLALQLRIFEDLSFKEISEIMDCPYDTAKANYRHGLMKLKNRFDEVKELNELRDYNSHISAPLMGFFGLAMEGIGSGGND